MVGLPLSSMARLSSCAPCLAFWFSLASSVSPPSSLRFDWKPRCLAMCRRAQESSGPESLRIRASARNFHGFVRISGASSFGSPSGASRVRMSCMRSARRWMMRRRARACLRGRAREAPVFGCSAFSKMWLPAHRIFCPSSSMRAKPTDAMPMSSPRFFAMMPVPQSVVAKVCS